MRMVFMRYPGGAAKAVTFSYDDGVATDKRLAELLSEHKMKCTFNFTAYCGNFTDEEIEKYIYSLGHELAVHGANHRSTGHLRPIEIAREVLDCRLELEKRTGRIIRGMAYPDAGITRFGNLGTYEEVKRVLSDLDIKYSRTLGGDNDSFNLPSDFHAWMPTAHHNNRNLFEYIDKFIELDLSTDVYYALRAPRLFYLWGHSYEFDRDNNWDRIEKVCEKFESADGIWYATNTEIYDYVMAYKSLSYSADNGLVYNPSLQKLWIDVDGKILTIDPGQTVRLS